MFRLSLTLTAGGCPTVTQRTYHTLLTRDLKHPISNQWCPDFGDYDKAVVEAERDDYRDKGWAAAELRIIETAPNQKEIDAAVAALNASEGAKVARK